MSFFDGLKAGAKKTTRQFTGITTIGDTLQTVRGELVYFKVSPANIAVLSPEATEGKIRELMMILSSVPEMELCCFDSAESFDANKNYLKRRIEEETTPAVRELLQLDLENLDKMQIATSTAREFVFVARFRREGEEQIFNALSRVEKAIKNQGFEVNRLQKEDIKKMLMIYFERNVTSEKLPDIDGEQAEPAPNSRTGHALNNGPRARAERSAFFENQE